MGRVNLLLPRFASAQKIIWRYNRTYLSCFFLSGNSKPNHPHGHGHSAIKDLAGSILGCNEDKKDEGELWNTVEAQTAFLGPNLWDKTYESDLKVCIDTSIIWQQQ